MNSSFQTPSKKFLPLSNFLGCKQKLRFPTVRPQKVIMFSPCPALPCPSLPFPALPCQKKTESEKKTFVCNGKISKQLVISPGSGQNVFCGGQSLYIFSEFSHSCFSPPALNSHMFVSARFAFKRLHFRLLFASLSTFLLRHRPFCTTTYVLLSLSLSLSVSLSESFLSLLPLSKCACTPSPSSLFFCSFERAVI